MGPHNDVEASPTPQTPRSPAFKMISRRADSRRKRVFLGVIIFLFIVFAVSHWRRSDVQDWVVYSGQSANSEVQAIAKSAFGGMNQPPTQEEKPMRTTRPTDMGPALSNGARSLSRQSLKDLRNETMGFGNVYVVNMPERMDKLDAMKLTASLTGFNFEVIPAVNGRKVSAKVLSKDFPEGENHDGQVGCWRSHLSIAHKIIENNLASAMILEDDADWDVALRSQLEHFALGSQSLLETSTKTVPFSPYGDGWDMIWLGHCASQPANDDWRRFLMKNDPTVTPPNHRANWAETPQDMSKYDNSTRIIYFSKGGTCTYSYGLSYHGAQKLLKWLSMEIYGKAIDFGLHDMCSKPDRNFKCIGVFPQLVGEHKMAGGSSRDTDIGAGGTQSRKMGFSYNIVHSTRMNADALIDGRFDDVVSQWPEDTPILTGPIVTEFRNDPTENTYDPSDEEQGV